MNNRWAKAPNPRTQLLLFSPSLDAMIPQDHAIRQLDEILVGMNWKEWEARYVNHRGQPPIHPRLLAGSILYGLIMGIRSSRKLEDATRNRIDFMWYLENRSIDHSTFAQFRQKFGVELKSLFRQINKAALRLSMSKLVELAADGTRLRAYSSLDGTRKAATLEKYLNEIDAKLAKALNEMVSEDIADNPELGSTAELKSELAALERKRLQYSNALAEAKKRDEARRKKVGSKAKPVKVPVADPESHVLPNKEGGYAPNYTPTVVVDKDSRLIVDEDVVVAHSEAHCIIPAVSEVEKEYGETPERMSFDGNLASGKNLSALSAKKIIAYSTVGTEPSEVVLRDDLSSPVAEKYWDDLPCKGKNKQLERSAFIFDGECYWCPMGKRLEKEKARPKGSSLNVVSEIIYRCKDCCECRLANRCLSGKAKYRSITRDENEDYREEMAARMKTEEAKDIYTRRAPIVETIFGYVKGVLGIRQFLTRGMNNVRTEWRWICTAYNLRTLLSLRQAHP
jgi:transposase